jgi:hypothetical protein
MVDDYGAKRSMQLFGEDVKNTGGGTQMWLRLVKNADNALGMVAVFSFGGRCNTIAGSGFLPLQGRTALMSWENCGVKRGGTEQFWPFDFPYGVAHTVVGGLVLGGAEVFAPCVGLMVSPLGTNAGRKKGSCNGKRLLRGKKAFSGGSGGAGMAEICAV